ncbi:MAG TPA: hypothetical protein VFW53_01165 [Gallionella sp.]|nr:hypothetical protein [Gallionella sp.]
MPIALAGEHTTNSIEVHHMGIQSTNGYTPLSFIANPSQQRQTYASATATFAASATSVTDKATISEAARNQLAEESKGGGAYDFTNMTPNQMRDAAQNLSKSGKIDSQQFLMLLSTGLTLGKQGKNGEYIPATEAETASHSNKPMNYVQYSKDRISFLESKGLTADSQYGYKSWKGILAVLQNTTSSSAASASV